MPPPPGDKALLRDYWPLVSLNKALLGPYFLGGGGIGGVPLGSHDIMNKSGDNASMVFDFQGIYFYIISPWKSYYIKTIT